MERYFDASEKQAWLAFLNQPCEGYTNFLHKYVRTGDINRVQVLLRFDADTKIKDEDGNTPLFKCLYMCAGSEESRPLTSDIAKALISKMSSHELCVRGSGRNRPTPLHLACSIGLNSIVKLLLDNGACVNAREYVSRKTPLLLAMTGHLSMERKELILYLLRYTDADVLDQFYGSYQQNASPLMRALELKDSCILRTVALKGYHRFSLTNEYLHRFPFVEKESDLVNTLNEMLTWRFPTLLVLCRDYIRRLLTNNLIAVHGLNCPSHLKRVILLEL